VGGSATVLQVVINPYLSACSVRGTQAVQRMAIGGSANSIGTTLAPYFVTGIVFGGMSVDDITVSQLSMPFMVLTLVIALLALGVRRMQLPELESISEDVAQPADRSVWSFRHLTLGVIAIFFYVGAEVCVGANITMYATDLSLENVALMATLYWGGILIGRLVGSSLSKVSPRAQLIVTTTGATILTLWAISANNPWILTAVGLCHSIMWGCIYTLAVKDLGRYTTAATGVFMMGVVGGAILPLLQGMWADMVGSWRSTWWIVVMAEIFMLYYAVFGSKIKE
ncbi:MAG: MFS transporter, partial [Muribaculaceae bacterium]|nr:MFS transporter [Muribaculaceae bacterium]